MVEQGEHARRDALIAKGLKRDALAQRAEGDAEAGSKRCPNREGIETVSRPATASGAEHLLEEMP